jgi:hypothetical protein
MGVLADIDTTLKNSDISLIKNTLFTNLCKSGRTDDCVSFSLYELTNLDLSIDDVELLTLNGVCRSHAVLSKIYPAVDVPISFVSDIPTCKLYMNDPAEFYKRYGIETDKLSKLTYTALTSGYMVEKILSCMMVFDIQTQQEYYTFRDAYLEKQWKTAYTDPSGVGMFYKYSFPSCN